MGLHVMKIACRGRLEGALGKEGVLAEGADLKQDDSRRWETVSFGRKRSVENTLVPALDAGPQKNRPYQSVVYRVGFNAIPRQAREQDSFSHSLTVP